MSLEFDSYEIRDICDINNSSYSPKESWSFFNYLDTKNITKGKIDEIKYLDPLEDIVPSRAKRKVNNKDIIYSTVRPNQEHYGLIENQPKNFLVSTGFTTLKVNTEKQFQNMFIISLLKTILQNLCKQLQNKVQHHILQSDLLTLEI